MPSFKRWYAALSFRFLYSNQVKPPPKHRITNVTPAHVGNVDKINAIAIKPILNTAKKPDTVLIDCNNNCLFIITP